MNLYRYLRSTILGAIVVCSGYTSLLAQDAPPSTVEEPMVEEPMAEEPTVDQVAEKLNNPNAAIGSLTLFTDFKIYDGDLPLADEQTGWVMTFQPSLPMPLGESGYNLLLRPAIPLILSEPIYMRREGFVNSDVELGNIGFDLAVGGTTKNGMLVLIGGAGLLPSATSEDLKAELAFGPEILIGVVTKKIVAGILVSQLWGVEDKETNSSILGGQYFINIPVRKGRTFGVAPVYSYDWNTEKWSFPIGIGYNAVTRFGKMPFKYGLQVHYYVSKIEDFDQLWQVRLQLTPVVKLPW